MSPLGWGSGGAGLGAAGAGRWAPGRAPRERGS